MRGPLIGLIIGCILGAFCIRWIWLRWQQHTRRAISRRAQIGEAEAEKLLQKQGYVILDAQVRRPVGMTGDGERVESFIKIDYLVAKGARTYLVEVKTGKQANVRLPSVRRQLFEYQNVFHTDGILFIDMNKYDIMEVSFDESDQGKPSLKYFIGGVLAGMLLMAFIYSYH